jgi:enoyl-CoA hydratase
MVDSPDGEVVRYEVRGRTGLITLDRPEVRNAIDGRVARGMEAALDRLEEDPEVWVGVLASSGEVFCAGADLTLFAEGRDGEMRTERGGFGGLVKRRRTKPLIAAVDGAALAGGFELVLACDLVVASRRARFGLPEVKRSLVAASGGAAKLGSLLPPATALLVVLTGDPIGAERANQLGLISELVDDGQALEGALELAERIAANAPLAVRESRRLALEAWALDAHAAIDDAHAALARLSSTHDYAEGPRAFLEKRPPVWTGH